MIVTIIATGARRRSAPQLPKTVVGSTSVANSSNPPPAARRGSSRRPPAHRNARIAPRQMLAVIARSNGIDRPLSAVTKFMAFACRRWGAYQNKRPPPSACQTRSGTIGKINGAARKARCTRSRQLRTIASSALATRKSRIAHPMIWAVHTAMAPRPKASAA